MEHLSKPINLGFPQDYSTFCKSPLAFVVVTSLLGVVDQHLLKPNPVFNNVIDDPKIALLSKKICSSLRYVLEKLWEIQTVDESQLDAKIRDVAVEAEAKIESKLREVYLATSSKGDHEATSRGLRETLQYVVEDIESLEAQIKIQKEFEVKSLPLKELSSTPAEAVKAESTVISCSSYHNLALGNEMIGRDVEFQKILDLILHIRRSDEVIAVTGMGGIGKSTLAQRVYEDPAIRSHFDICAWTVLSQQHNVKEILLCLLGQMCIGIYTTDDNEEQLANQLFKSLFRRRYLIVVDDVWSTQAWDDIKPYFPNSISGSRILMTTRLVEVASYATSSQSFVFRMPFLNLDESWKLLVREVFKRRDCPPPDEFESIGRKIVKRCGGLPISIILIAGILVGRLNMSPHESWNDFAPTINSALMEVESSGHTSIFALSYKHLPVHLKACFLYLGIFPMGSVIYVKKLIKLWVAEGFLEPKMHNGLEEVAMNYLNDLIDRNLVLVVKQNYDKKVKSCKLHDLVHDFCLRKAQEENMVVVSNDDLAGTRSDTKQPKLGCRWISCQSRRWPFTRSSSLNYTQGKIHSILYFGKDLHPKKCRLMFQCLELLRVLDLSSIQYSNGMPSEIVNLIHLRYLALTTVGSLHNSQLFKLQSLQTLILLSWKEGFHFQLPCDILDLPWLRHVHIDKGSSLYLPNSIQGNLQTLFWLKVTSWDTKTPDFKMVPNLKELGIYIEGGVSSNALDSFTQLHQLEKLKFEVRGVDHFNLPVSFPSSIKKLTFCKTDLPWEKMDIISKLPILEVLKLKDFAFRGSKWDASEEEFTNLKFFLIERSDLKHWKASSDNFPGLKHLVLKNCWDLVSIPSEFADIYTLESIELESCCSSLEMSAEEIKDEVQDWGGDLLVRKLGIKDKTPEEESETEEEDSEGSDDVN
ncbi:PREDICTED: putative late blight resistance protein homolog R1B-14 [Ipomoea nil]|uniref:putative late blight resistance protein homolog R1B-14 n=1 Tax=Ipomoea nil TaxID=35883 RepID=UPI000901D040|nr:PREDICTED: putative late blight resistance protein homolog R1B-14 [Ipomoea nil]